MSFFHNYMLCIMKYCFCIENTVDNEDDQTDDNKLVKFTNITEDIIVETTVKNLQIDINVKNNEFVDINLK